MSHGKKPKHKKKLHPTGHKHSEGDKKVDNNPGHVHVSGKTEVDIPQDPLKKYDAAGNREDRWKRKEFIVSIITAVLIFGYTTVAAWQGCSSEKAAKAARDSVAISTATLKVSQGAYVTIGRKDGTIADFVVPKDPTQDAEIVIYFQNTGHSPAKFAWGTMGVSFLAKGSKSNSSGITYVHPFKGFLNRTRDKKTGGIGEVGESTTIAGDSVLVSTMGKISQKALAELPANDIGTVTMGMFSYCDQLGDYSIHQFAIRYRSHAPTTNLSFDLAGDFEVPLMPLPESTASTEYLPPCKVLNEK